METQPGTHASVTTAPCTCNSLHDWAVDPRSPVIFDGRAGEFQIQYLEPGCDGPSHIIVFHCFFCGGAAPKSLRHLLFQVVPPAEEQRLAALLRPVKTIRSALRRLGTPQRDDPAGERTTTPEADGSPPITRHHRVLVSERLSDMADVRISELPDGRASWSLTGKATGRAGRSGDSAS